MPLPGVCPSCGAAFDLPAALADAEARQALAAALELPAPLARLVVPYIALHAPTSGRRMAWSKLARLLRELRELVTSGQVTRNRITRAAPLDQWQRGLEAVLERRDAGTLNLPLDNDHAYLEEVVWRHAGRAAGQAEQKQEERKQHFAHRTSQGGPQSTNAVLKTIPKLPQEAVDSGRSGAKKLRGALNAGKTQS